MRRAIGWLFVALSLVIAVGPASFLLWVMRAEATEPAFWSRLLGGYSLFITIPTTSVLVIFVALQQRNKGRRSFGFSIVLGTILGLIVGLLLTLVTAGYSLLSAPAVGLLSALVVWLIQPPARSAS